MLTSILRHKNWDKQIARKHSLKYFGEEIMKSFNYILILKIIYKFSILTWLENGWEIINAFPFISSKTAKTNANIINIILCIILKGLKALGHLQNFEVNKLITFIENGVSRIVHVIATPTICSRSLSLRSKRIEFAKSLKSW